MDPRHVTTSGLLAMLMIQTALAAGSTTPEILDTRGKEFIIGFMENQILDPAVDLPQDIELFVSTLAEYADVTVTMPKFDVAWVKTVRVFREFPEKIIVPRAVVAVGTEKVGKGVRVQATEEVTVSVVNKEKFSTDAYLALPVNAVGTEYWAMTYVRKPELLVAAIQDGTTVSITLPASKVKITYGGEDYVAGDTLTVTLDRYEILHIQDDRSWELVDLTGAHVLSNKPVTVISGNRKVKVPKDSATESGDHLTECLFPVTTWGREFPIINTADRTGGDVYRFLAAYNNTVLTFTNGAVINLNAGKFKEIDLPANTERFVRSNRPIQVALFSRTWAQDGPRKGDPSMTLIPPTNQFINEHTWSTVTAPGDLPFSNKLSVVIETSKIGGLRVDHAVHTWQRNAVIPGSSMSFLWGFVGEGAHNVYHVQPNVNFLVIASGTATVNSYAFPGNTRLARVNAPCTPSTPADGDGIDNDCDGRVDEELRNKEDDDGDGSVNEDTSLRARVNGVWGPWSSYSSCSVTCGIGSQSRTRVCNNPVPANGGLPCVSSPVEFTTCVLPQCPGGTGPLCGDPLRHCLSSATCDAASNQCVCPSGTTGDPTFHCYPTGRRRCTSELDPNVVTYDGASTHVNLPCRYRLGMVETSVVSPANQMFDKCRVTVVALNGLDSLRNVMFVRSMEVKVEFLRYNAQSEAVMFASSSTTFVITQEDITNAAAGTNPWLESPTTVNNVLMLPAWDNNNNIAILNVPQCDLAAQFRVFNVNEYIQTLKGGVSLVAPPSAVFDNVPGFSACGRPGDGGNRFLDLANVTSVEGPMTAMLFGILTDATVDQNVNNPSYQAECTALLTTVTNCDPGKRPLAFDLCNRIVNKSSFLECIGNQGANPLVTLNQCLTWACQSDTASCNSYYTTVTDGSCPTAPRMSHIGCDAARLAQAIAEH